MTSIIYECILINECVRLNSRTNVLGVSRSCHALPEFYYFIVYVISKYIELKIVY